METETETRQARYSRRNYHSRVDDGYVRRYYWIHKDRASAFSRLQAVIDGCGDRGIDEIQALIDRLNGS